MGVCKTSKKAGLGTLIVDYIVSVAIKQNHYCACKFITVDAYNESIGFYEKLGFKYFTDADKEQGTRQMYLDLTPLVHAAMIPG